ncbi:hypothetical protein SOVF_134720, partial [Spinacia oleracea]
MYLHWPFGSPYVLWLFFLEFCGCLFITPIKIHVLGPGIMLVVLWQPFCLQWFSLYLGLCTFSFKFLKIVLISCLFFSGFWVHVALGLIILCISRNQCSFFNENIVCYLTGSALPTMLQSSVVNFCSVITIDYLIFPIAPLQSSAYVDFFAATVYAFAQFAAFLWYAYSLGSVLQTWLLSKFRYPVSGMLLGRLKLVSMRQPSSKLIIDDVPKNALHSWPEFYSNHPFHSPVRSK